MPFRCRSFHLIVTCAIFVGAIHNCALAQSKAAPNDSKVQELYNEARSAQKSGDLASAAAKYEAIIKIAPQLQPAYNNLGLLYFQQRDYAKAAAVLERAVKLDPASAATSTLLGMSLYELGDYAAARPHLDAALRANPKDANAELFLARTLVKLEDFEAAAVRLKHLTGQQPENQEAWYLLGQAYIKLSENAISKMNAIDPNSALSHEISGQIMESMNNYDGALVEYRKAVDIAPHEAGMHYALGNAYWHLGQWDAATEQFNAELENDPHNCMAEWKLGNILLEQNLDPERALAETDNALKMCPNLVQARVDHARALLKLNRSQDALPDLITAIKSNPDEAPIHFLLAQAYRGLGRADDARSEMAIFSKLEENARAATARRAQDVIKTTNSR